MAGRTWVSEASYIFSGGRREKPDERSLNIYCDREEGKAAFSLTDFKRY